MRKEEGENSLSIHPSSQQKYRALTSLAQRLSDIGTLSGGLSKKRHP